MSTAALLTELSRSGCTLRRLSGDRLKVTGDLPPALAERLRDAKPELLAIFPDPDTEICRTWAEAVEGVNDILSQYPHWSGTPEQWREHDQIQAEFSAARAAGDVEAAQAAATSYREWATRAWGVEAAFEWAGDTRRGAG